jgi:hypothetical protein
MGPTLAAVHEKLELPSHHGELRAATGYAGLPLTFAKKKRLGTD